MSALSITKRSLSINLLEAHTAITDPHHQEAVAVEALLVVVLLVDSAACSAAVLVFGTSSSKVNKTTVEPMLELILKQLLRKRLSKLLPLLW